MGEAADRRRAREDERQPERGGHPPRHLASHADQQDRGLRDRQAAEALMAARASSLLVRIAFATTVLLAAGCGAAPRRSTAPAATHAAPTAPLPVAAADLSSWVDAY